MARLFAVVVYILVATPAAARAPAPAQPSAEPEAPAAVPSQRVDLIYTGQTQGFSSSASYGAKFPILLLWDYFAARKGVATIERSGWVLRQGPCLLVDPADMRTGRTVQMLRGDPPRARVLVERLPVLESDHVIVYQYPPDPSFDLLRYMERQNRLVPMDPVLRRGVARLIEYRAPDGKRVLALDQSGSQPTPLSWLPKDPTAWELWWGARGYARLHGQRGTYYVVLKMRGYGARRFRHIQSLRGALGTARTMLVSAGNEVDTGDSARDAKRSSRGLDFGALGALKYTAILPDAAELYFGVDDLKRQAERHKLTLVATNLTHASGDDAGKPVFERFLVRRIGGVRVGILGFVNPDVAEHVRERDTLSEVKVEEPFEAFAKALMEMHSATETRPELVVVLSNLRDRALTQFLAKIRGVSIFIGDFTRAPAIYPAVETLDARDRAKDLQRQRSPLIEVHGSSTRVGHIVTHLTKPGRMFEIERIEHSQKAITADLPRADWLHRNVMAAELRERGALESVLIPGLDEIIEKDADLLKYFRQDPEYLNAFPIDRDETERSLAWFTPRIWSNVVAGIVREASRCDAAVVRSVPQLQITTPGAVLREYVLGWAATEEQLVLYTMGGAYLRQLVRLGLRDVTIAGVDVDELKVGGRDIDDDEQYRVALGSAVAASGPVMRLLGDLEAQTKFTLDRGRVSASRKGRALRLREIVLETLEELRRADPEFGKGYRARFRKWLLPGGSALLPLWMFRAESISFSFSNYAQYPRGSWMDYRGVRETRAVTPSNYTIQLKGALAVTYDSAKIAWETRAAFELTRTLLYTNQAEQPVQILKTADDLVASTEFRLKVIGLDLGAKGRVSLTPYVNATFDTEFTPTENAVTGEVYPHQKELYGSAGIVTYPGQTLQEVRLAGIVRTDFAVAELYPEAPRGSIVDGGILFGTRAEFSFWKAKLTVSGTLRYFAPRSTDTPDRLGLLVQGETKLVVPFTSDLSVSLGADLFLFRPKLREATYTDEDGSMVTVVRGTAASLILSAGFSFDHTWKL